MALPMLDLFSGIGGFAFALRKVARPVAYCEIDPTCRCFLLHKMKQGVIPTAPIHPDVRLLTSKMIKGKPLLICAGFPCQDISVLNSSGEGLKGERSKLFFEVIRLLQELPSVQHVFLENSPMIMHRGLEQVQAAFEKLHFNLRFKVISASECGAPHERKRWWCVASRNFDSIKIMAPLEKSVWASSQDPCPRLVLRAPGPLRTYQRKLIQLLGSAVVPVTVQTAWNSLTQPRWRKPCFSQYKIPVVLAQGNVIYALKSLGTPLSNSGSSLTQHNKLTYRASKLLSNQLFFDKDLKIKVPRGKKVSDLYDINVCFIEYMMGYPPGYTL